MEEASAALGYQLYDEEGHLASDWCRQQQGLCPRGDAQGEQQQQQQHTLQQQQQQQQQHTPQQAQARCFASIHVLPAALEKGPMGAYVCAADAWLRALSSGHGCRPGGYVC